MADVEHRSSKPKAPFTLYRVGVNGTAYMGMYQVNADGTSGPSCRAGDGEYVYAPDALREVERLRAALTFIAQGGNTYPADYPGGYVAYLENFARQVLEQRT